MLELLVMLRSAGVQRCKSDFVWIWSRALCSCIRSFSVPHIVVCTHQNGAWQSPRIRINPADTATRVQTLNEGRRRTTEGWVSGHSVAKSRQSPRRSTKSASKTSRLHAALTRAHIRGTRPARSAHACAALQAGGAATAGERTAAQRQRRQHRIGHTDNGSRCVCSSCTRPPDAGCL